MHSQNIVLILKDASAYPNAYFGESSGPYHLDYIHCNGNEANLLNCTRQYTEIGVQKCSPGNEAGVRCDGKFNA